MPLGFQLPPSDWRPTPLSEMPSWRDAKRISLDFETRDPSIAPMKGAPRGLGPGELRGGYICGVAFAIEDGPAHYLPMRHEGGDNLPVEGVEGYVRDQLRGFNGAIVGSNLGYELGYGWEAGFEFNGNARLLDIGLAEPLIDELQWRYGMDYIAERYNLPGKDETLLRAAADAYGVPAKENLWRLPARYVGPYATQDVRLPLQVMRKQERRIEEAGMRLDEAWLLEQQVLPVLARMRRRGVRVSLERVEAIEVWAYSVEAEESAKIKALTGVDIGVGNFAKPTLLERALSAIGLKPPRTPTTNKASINKAWLKAHPHPVTDSILRGREFNKVRTTFCKSVRMHEIQGRLHCVFNQLRKASSEDDDGNDDEEDGVGARSARLSAAHPNLQQQPVRNKEYGKKWRSIFIAEEDEEWAKLDYSQQEPRLIVHYAEERGLEGASVFGDRYRNDPSTDFHSMTAEISGLERPDAKNLGLGLAYGMGEAHLCHDLKLPTVWRPNRKGEMKEKAGPEGKAKMDLFHERVPFIRLLAKECEAAVKAKGFIIGLAGHHFHFPKDDHDNYDWLHKALNRLIQGSAAGQTKKAVVEADRAGFPLRLQVHDELDLSVASRREARDLGVLMRDVVPLCVPMLVEVDVGPSWGEKAATVSLEGP